MAGAQPLPAKFSWDAAGVVKVSTKGSRTEFSEPNLVVPNFNLDHFDLITIKVRLLFLH